MQGDFAATPPELIVVVRDDAEAAGRCDCPAYFGKQAQPICTVCGYLSLVQLYTLSSSKSPAIAALWRCCTPAETETVLRCCRASDIWACGVILFHMLCCKLPFQARCPALHLQQLCVSQSRSDVWVRPHGGTACFKQADSALPP